MKTTTAHITLSGSVTPVVEIINDIICIDLSDLDRDSAIEVMKHIGREARPPSLVCELRESEV